MQIIITKDNNINEISEELLDKDVIEVSLQTDKKSIGIDELDELKKFLSVLDVNRVGVIYNAERLTDSAQNSLLKTLEENSHEIYLIVESVKDILPTVYSRANNIRKLKDDIVYSDDDKYILSILKLDIIDKLKFSMDNGNRAEYILKIYLKSLEHDIKTCLKIDELLQKVSAGVNGRNILDEFFLTYEKA